MKKMKLLSLGILMICLLLGSMNTVVAEETDDQMTEETAIQEDGYIYASQPINMDEVQAIIDSFLNDPNANDMPKWELAIDESWIPSGWQQVSLQDGEYVYYTLQMMMTTYASWTPPAYNNQTWYIYSGADLHYAIANANNSDTFLIMNNLHMGTDCGVAGHTHNHPDMDGIADEIVIGSSNAAIVIDGTTYTRNNLTGFTLYFKSGTGNEISIYRHDHKRHMVIGNFSFNGSGKAWTNGASDLNINLVFENIAFDGNQTSDMEAKAAAIKADANEKKTISDSSRGGIMVGRASNVTLDGIIVRNCFSEILNMDVYEVDLLGRADGTDGGAILLTSANGFVLKNALIENNVSGAFGGALTFYSNAGTIIDSEIKNNLSFNPVTYSAGGGISFIGTYGDALIDGSLISGNEIYGVEPSSYYFEYGGGVMFNGYTGTLSIVDTIIEKNLAQRGGGLFAAGPVILTDVTIRENFASDRRQQFGNNNIDPAGAGVFQYANNSMTFNGKIEITDNIVEIGDYASSGSAAGIYLTSVTVSSNTTVSVTDNVIIAKNNSTGRGAGMYVVPTSTGIVLDGWTVSGNEIVGDATGYGGGMYLSLTAGELTLNNFFMEKNVAPHGGAIYVGPSGYSNLKTNNITFTGNVATSGGFYLDSVSDAANASIHGTNIINTVSLSMPFDVSTGYAYNNFDIYYAQGTPVYLIVLEYHLGTIGTTPYRVETIIVNALNQDVVTILEAWDASWQTKHMPATHAFDSVLMASSTNDTAVAKVQVLYISTGSGGTTTPTTPQPTSPATGVNDSYMWYSILAIGAIALIIVGVKKEYN